MLQALQHALVGVLAALLELLGRAAHELFLRDEPNLLVSVLRPAQKGLADLAGSIHGGIHSNQDMLCGAMLSVAVDSGDSNCSGMPEKYMMCYMMGQLVFSYQVAVNVTQMLCIACLGCYLLE